jgi:hypothetical protein
MSGPKGALTTSSSNRRQTRSGGINKIECATPSIATSVPDQKLIQENIAPPRSGEWIWRIFSASYLSLIFWIFHC